MIIFRSPFTTGFVVALALASLSARVDALPDDRFQDLSISSDSTEMLGDLDDDNGTITYAGNVVVEQGSMKINAEKVVIYRQKGNYTKVLATGTPARVSQIPKEGQEPVTGRANRMEYQVTSETLILLDNAAFSQEGTSLSGNRIEYDVKRSIVKAGGKADAEGDDRRVRMVIPPKALREEQQQDSSASGDTTTQ